MPYLAAEARESIRTSAPLMRPVYFDHPTLATAWSHPLQWMLGSDLFVSPVVTEGEQEHETALPPGAWVDAWTGEPHVGGELVRMAVPLDQVPVFVRAAAWPRLRDVFPGRS